MSYAVSRPSLNEANTKIVATVGPACDRVDQLASMIEAGVDVFRINTAHGNRDENAKVLAKIREASDQVGFQVAVLLDLAGPKIRLGELSVDPTHCSLGERFSLIRGDISSSPNELTSSYKTLVEELEPGDRVMLADAAVTLEVQAVEKDRAECVVIAEGSIRSRQGINLPGVKLSVSSMLPRDIENAIWAAENGIDLVSLSFVRTAKDVLQLKELLTFHNSQALVIAKIEKPEALENLESIVEATDAVMVARGDLGVEIDVAETPVAQKRIIRVCRQQLKPVIVATQMLESMHHSSRPTRAEVSDVANAIHDGADACMLSGETAIGQYPLESVRMMGRIMRATERDLNPTTFGATTGNQVIPENLRVHPITTAVSVAATRIAESIHAKLIVIATRSGNTAWIGSQSRCLIPTLGISDSPETLRRMNLLWGIKPFYVEKMEDTSGLIDKMCQWSRENGGLKRGDHLVLVTGTGVFEKAHNLVVVHTIP